MKNDRRELICTTCYLCQFDCVSKEDMSKCPNFKKGYTATEYKKFISESNVNLRKLCDKNNLKLNYMYDMLNERQHFSYKYRHALDSILFEKEEYAKYVIKFENEGFAYG